MDFKDLSREQIIQLKQRLYCERNENASDLIRLVIYII